MTPYPGTALHQRIADEQRIVTGDWELYDTRHVVFEPRGMTPEQLEAGYWRAYRDFYRWSAIWNGAAGQESLRARARHLAYAGGWRKFEPLWDLIIRARRVNSMLPALERTLDGGGLAAPALPRPRSRGRLEELTQRPSGDELPDLRADTVRRPEMDARPHP
jgi:hypothetical protein